METRSDAPKSDMVDEIDIAHFFAIIWRGRRRVLISILAVALLALSYLHLATYTYSVSLKVAPVAGDVSLQGNRLAGLLGIRNLGKNPLSFELYLEGLGSRFAADSLAQKAGVLKGIFKDEWNAEADEWRDPGGIARSIKSVLFLLVGKPQEPWKPPSGERLQEYLQSGINVDRPIDSPLVTLSINAEDPEFGRYLLQSLHQTIDDYLRREAIEQRTRQISYLTDQLARVSVMEYREALTSILKEEEKFLMMAKGSNSFAADPLGASEASLYPTRPKTTLVLLSAIILGFLIGAVLVLLREFKAMGRANRP